MSETVNPYEDENENGGAPPVSSSDRTLILDQSSDVSTADHTTVDLGDDLLKTKTTMYESQRSTDVIPNETNPNSIADWIESAKILMSEGIFGEAKKNLRKVIFNDPTNTVAQKLLDQIQDIEVQRLLQEEQTSVFQRRRIGDDVREPHEVLEQLMSDLNIHFNEEEESEKPFASDEVEAEFNKWVKSFSVGAKAKDYLDFGVALIQMQLYDQAINQFQKAESDTDLNQQARSLKAYAMILGGKAFQGLLELDSLIENKDRKSVV